MKTARRKPGQPTGLGFQRAQRRQLWTVTIVVPLVFVVVSGLMFIGNRSREKSTAGALPAASPAPPVALPATTGATVDIAAFRGKSNVLLYFYEHAG